jgi:hypothetical protein
MAWFLFAGDMLVMLFMTGLIIWLSVRGTATLHDYSARIPLDDEVRKPRGDHHG